MTIAPVLLSGSTSGRNIEVTGTATGTAVTVHAAVAGSSDMDEVTLFAHNTSALDVELTLECGGTTVSADNIVVNVPAKTTLMVLPSTRYNGGVAIKAFAATADVINLLGSVNRYTVA